MSWSCAGCSQRVAALRARVVRAGPTGKIAAARGECDSEHRLDQRRAGLGQRAGEGVAEARRPCRRACRARRGRARATTQSSSGCERSVSERALRPGSAMPGARELRLEDPVGAVRADHDAPRRATRAPWSRATAPCTCRSRRPGRRSPCGRGRRPRRRRRTAGPGRSRRRSATSTRVARRARGERGVGETAGGGLVHHDRVLGLERGERLAEARRVERARRSRGPRRARRARSRARRADAARASASSAAATSSPGRREHVDARGLRRAGGSCRPGSRRSRPARACPRARRCAAGAERLARLLREVGQALEGGQIAAALEAREEGLDQRAAAGRRGDRAPRRAARARRAPRRRGRARRLRRSAARRGARDRSRRRRARGARRRRHARGPSDGVPARSPAARSASRPGRAASARRGSRRRRRAPAPSPTRTLRTQPETGRASDSMSEVSGASSGEVPARVVADQVHDAASARGARCAGWRCRWRSRGRGAAA